LITFTTGSTGAPKASARSHAFLTTQHEVLARHLGTTHADVDLTTLPVFVLHDLAAGATSVLAGVDPRRPERLEARRLRGILARERVTTMVASPAIAERLAASVAAPLPLRALFTGGAPVLPALARLLVERVAGEAVVLYGSTEAEPIARISCRAFLDALAEPGALGLCAGPPVEELELALLRPTDGPLDTLDRVSANVVGEVAVAGAHVAVGYFENEAADARHKVKDGARTWHRTGDAARLDASGRLWLMGRLGQRIERDGVTWWPLPAELRALTLPGVRHAAWFGKGSRAVLCVECAPGTAPTLAAARAALAPMPLDDLYVLDRIPRDPRHHSKTDLESLERRLRRASPRA
jgi:acyl-CoA synthetase (AMP-forming)/AMP-acid ligase II